MSPTLWALDMVKNAVEAAPALGELLGDALDALNLSPSDPRHSLAEEVRAVLPAKSATRDALDLIEATEKKEP